MAENGNQHLRATDVSMYWFMPRVDFRIASSSLMDTYRPNGQQVYGGSIPQAHTLCHNTQMMPPYSLGSQRICSIQSIKGRGLAGETAQFMIQTNDMLLRYYSECSDIPFEAILRRMFPNCAISHAISPDTKTHNGYGSPNLIFISNSASLLQERVSLRIRASTNLNGGRGAGTIYANIKRTIMNGVYVDSNDINYFSAVKLGTWGPTWTRYLYNKRLLNYINLQKTPEVTEFPLYVANGNVVQRALSLNTSIIPRRMQENTVLVHVCSDYYLGIYIMIYKSGLVTLVSHSSLTLISWLSIESSTNIEISACCYDYDTEANDGYLILGDSSGCLYVWRLQPYYQLEKLFLKSKVNIKAKIHHDARIVCICWNKHHSSYSGVSCIRRNLVSLDEKGKVRVWELKLLSGHRIGAIHTNEHNICDTLSKIVPASDSKFVITSYLGDNFVLAEHSEPSNTILGYVLTSDTIEVHDKVHHVELESRLYRSNFRPTCLIEIPMNGKYCAIGDGPHIKFIFLKEASKPLYCSRRSDRTMSPLKQANISMHLGRLGVVKSMISLKPERNAFIVVTLAGHKEYVTMWDVCRVCVDPESKQMDRIDDFTDAIYNIETNFTAHNGRTKVGWAPWISMKISRMS